MCRRIEFGYLVDNLGFVLERAETVCKAHGDEELIPFAAAEQDGDVFPIGRRTETKIDGDIEDRPATDPNEFVLRVRGELKMQTTYRFFLPRKRAIVLNEE
jgi:hypothetical protein